MASIQAIFREFLSQYPRQFTLLFCLLTVEGGIAAASVLSMVPMADFMLDPALANPTQITKIVISCLSYFGLAPDFWIFGSIFIFSNLLKGVLEVCIRYAILRIKYDVVQTLFVDSLQIFFRARWGFFSGAEQGVLLNTLTGELNTIGETLGQLAMLLAQLIQLCIYLAVPLWLNPQVTIITLTLVLLFGSPFLLLRSMSYRFGVRNAETANVALGVLSEILGAARIILGFGRQSQASDRFLLAFNQHSQATLKSQTLGVMVPRIFHVMAILAALIAMGIGMRENTPISELAAVMWSLLGAMPILVAILHGNISVSNFIPSYEQLMRLRKSATDLAEISGARKFQKLDYGVELKNVTFTYPGRESTLTGVNLSLPKGSMVALVGESGSGKSTIVDLILGLQIPQSGDVLIDNISLNDWRLNSFRDRVGYVPQDSQLFHLSIRENMLWALDSATEKEIWDALGLANAVDFVKVLPKGLDTIVGDRGTLLSGGQRQRLALARALLREPELLILDEATSALDSESENLIQKAIEKIAGKTTVLIIAHRLSTIAKANYVYVVSKGIIIEHGTVTSLKDSPSSVLSSMFLAQTS